MSSKDGHDLPGLGQFLNELGDSQAPVKRSSNTKTIAMRRVLDFEEKISEFHRIKVPNAIRNTQAKHILAIKQKELEEMRQHCLERLAHPESNLHKFMEELFE